MDDPNIKTTYQVLKENLKAADRVTFINRYIYIGEHTFAEKDKDIAEVFEEIINRVNTSDGTYEKLTGVLIHYSKYFIHVVDGSDDSLIRHLQILIAENETSLGSLKFLVTYNHINQRFYNVWNARETNPSLLLDGIDTNSDLKDTMGYASRCLKKVYTLALKLRVINRSNDESPDLMTIGEIDEELINYVPELQLLEFLLRSPHTQDVRKYVDRYATLPDIVQYDDFVLPVPNTEFAADAFREPPSPISLLKDEKKARSSADSFF